jgi:hypothetical protein
MTSAAIDRMIANAKRHFASNDHERQMAEFRARQHFFPSTVVGGDRQFVSPLGGQAISKPEPQPKTTAPKNDRWW